MSEIKKGDTVICINTGDIGGNPSHSLPPLRKNAEYLVQAIYQCPCGMIDLDVGLSQQPDQRMNCNCGRVTLNDPIWWCSIKRFVKKQSLEEKVSEALEKEDYETLTKLRPGTQ